VSEETNPEQLHSIERVLIHVVEGVVSIGNVFGTYDTYGKALTEDSVIDRARERLLLLRSKLDAVVRECAGLSIRGLTQDLVRQLRINLPSTYLEQVILARKLLGLTIREAIRPNPFRHRMPGELVAPPEILDGIRILLQRIPVREPASIGEKRAGVESLRSCLQEIGSDFRVLRPALDQQGAKTLLDRIETIREKITDTNRDWEWRMGNSSIELIWDKRNDAAVGMRLRGEREYAPLNNLALLPEREVHEELLALEDECDSLKTEMISALADLLLPEKDEILSDFSALKSEVQGLAGRIQNRSADGARSSDSVSDAVVKEELIEQLQAIQLEFLRSIRELRELVGLSGLSQETKTATGLTRMQTQSEIDALLARRLNVPDAIPLFRYLREDLTGLERELVIGTMVRGITR
jgi:hypothetical protein